MGRRLSAVWLGPPQRLRHAGSPRSVAPARPFPAPSLFVRASARIRLLGHRRNASFIPDFLMALDKVSSACFDSNQTSSRISERNGRTLFSNILFTVTFICVAAVVVMPKPTSPDSTPLLAATPPMGWNSWDAYGETVSEADIRANAKWMAEHLKSYGWQYVVVDSGWYVTNHSAGTNAESAQFSLDAFGRYTPAVNTIPSAEQGA